MNSDKSIMFITLGCKTNQYETNAMEQKFQNNGYKIIKDENEKADVCIVNTCSVTNVAERKSRQMLRRVKEINPSAIIVACGCYAQVGKEELEQMQEVDIILGINEKNNIVEIIDEYIENYKNILEEQSQQKNKKIEISDVMHTSNFEDFGTTTYTELNRAVIKIQDGCDRFCSYCIIPFARGKVRSRNPQSIIKEIEEISRTGIKEVVLTGIHLASYGKDFKQEKVDELRKKYEYSENYEEFNPKEDLATGGFRLIELLEQLNKINSIERIRLGSIEPKLITEEFVDRLSKLDKICDHFHLSLQSGCDETLKRMNRRYTTEEFRKSVNMLRNTYPKVALTTDVIVGFPGETDEEFEKTYEFLKEIKFYKMHIFKYSPRRGTVAEKLPNQVDGKIKEERSKKLIELSNSNQIEYNKKIIGQEVKVLFEEREEKYFKGHTSNYILVKVETEEDLENKIQDVRITRLDEMETVGELTK